MQFRPSPNAPPVAAAFCRVEGVIEKEIGFELWLPGEDFPRRASGAVAAGSSLELEGLEVHAAVFRWHLEGQEALGQYELAVRAPAPEAA